jgi:hypothetical protein
MEDLTDKEIRIIKHMIGVSNMPTRKVKAYIKKGDYYRNRFIGGKDHPEDYLLKSLVAKDLVAFEEFRGGIMQTGDIYYYLNDKGLEVAKTLC